MEKLLELKNLYVSFRTYAGKVQAVRGVNLYLKKGETLAIVGESGSGKSVTSKTIMKLLPSNSAHIDGGEILFEGKNLVQYSEKDMQKVRGSEISMIFQDPMSALNPTMTIGNQIIESLMAHQKIDKKQAALKAVELLKLVGIPNAEARIKQYPHQFSGGMRQRVVIAIALACNPKVLIADEPTTALDVTIQAQILDLMKDIQKKMGTSIIIITHDLGVVANIADRVAVMYAGKIVETGTVEEVFYHPQHPYTWGLLGSMPNMETREELIAIPGTPPDLLNPPKGDAFAERNEFALKVDYLREPPMFKLSETHYAATWLLHGKAPKIEKPAMLNRKRLTVTKPNLKAAAEKPQSKEPLVEIKYLKKYFNIGKNEVLKAVDDISFTIFKGETLGLVGESGCGKSTAGRTLMRLYDATDGEVLFQGEKVHGKKSPAELKEFNRKVQMIFQDPYASLNPRKTVADIIAEGIDIHGLAASREERREKVYELLETVGLNKDHANRYPHEFSGGQRQRIGIARALAVEPEFIIADEPISALDVSIQAQVVNLMKKLQKERGLTYLFIAHDLSMVKHISDRVGVMYLGNMVELASSDDLYDEPLHPYTQALLSAVPVPDPDREKSRERIILEGDLPSPSSPPSGCRFRTRCPHATEICASTVPQWREAKPNHWVACHLF
ncbi:ABC transporter ATP-binding protein [Cytobacillus oceanisediminis]|uniref:ABC transporter ATP-binding protein n=1 Tax=Cytobacillus oceanisediminis TaxID=665099 RepID=UPI0023DB6512|nr:ABC transporter ATP-binding protein [Cytobacillus oceanisediminis]MDF2037763.1 ABC transporter ATP-binding protein [Cytobacillus oceanisediminis]